jgi:hypothetical protein
LAFFVGYILGNKAFTPHNQQGLPVQAERARLGIWAPPFKEGLFTNESLLPKVIRIPGVNKTPRSASLGQALPWGG